MPPSLSCFRATRFLFAVCPLVLACGGIAAEPSGNDDDALGSGGSTGGALGSGNGPSSGGKGPTGGGSGGRATGGTHPDGDGGSAGGMGGDSGEGVLAPELVKDPNPSEVGLGNCSGTTLEQFVTQVRDGWPELSDIGYYYREEPQVGDGSMVFVLQSASGFSLAFRRGWGDCPAGCISEEVFYFGSTLDCTPELLGKYSAVYDTEGNCFQVEGLPSWNIGRKVTAQSRCDFDPTPLAVTGDYFVQGEGTGNSCGTDDDVPWNRDFHFSITQSEEDPATGTVRFMNMWSPKLDDTAWPARILGNEVIVEVSDQSDACVDSIELSFSYDFAAKEGQLRFFEVQADDCSDPDSDYCKGTLTLELFD